MLLDRDRAYFRIVARSHRVILCGEGPDAALHYEWRPYVDYMARHHRWGSLVRESLVHVALHRRLPLLSTVPRAMREKKLERTWSSGYPAWINPEFEQRMKLAERWAEEEASPRHHDVRPVGYTALSRARWQTYFEEFDSAGTGAPMEFRHPFFDIRVLRFLLAIPALPWCRRKYIMRRAMRGMLPDMILQRDKTPLYPDPWTALAQKIGFPALDPSPGLSDYVKQSKVFVGTPGTLADFRDAIRPRSLNYWLKSDHQIRHN